MSQTWPKEIERTRRATYWELPDGTFFATKPTVVLPPPIQTGGYPILKSLKKLKGDI
jgi:hypothetical protein